MWEATLASWIPGARRLSIRQWSLASAEDILGGDALRLDIHSDVSATVGLVMLAITVLIFGGWAIYKLQTLTVRGRE